MTNYDWPFWTLPFGLFGSNLDTRDLETYPRTYSGPFLTIPGPFEYFSENGWSQKIIPNEGVIVTPLISLVLGGEVPRLNHGPICWQYITLKGVLQAIKSSVPLF